MQNVIEPAAIRKVGPQGAVKQKRGRPKGSKNKRPRSEVLTERAANPNSEWLSAREVAMRYGIYPGTVRSWVAKGSLPAPYLVAENTVRWSRAELDERDAKLKPVGYYRHNAERQS